MHELGIRGAPRGRSTVRTTLVAATGGRSADLVDRQFHTEAPNRLWVADLPYVKTHAGWVYVAFIIDVYSRYVVGWQASGSLGANVALDALEMAIWFRAGRAWTASSTTRVAGRNTWRSATRNVSPTLAWRGPLAPAETATTTPWLNRSKGSTRRR